MAEEIQWQLPQKGPGRLYYFPEEIEAVRYGDTDALIARVSDSLKEFLKIESTVRLLLDGYQINKATTVMTVPFEGTNEQIYTNLARLVVEQLWGYYLSSHPKTTHHGLSNLVYEDNETNLVRRETEKFLRRAPLPHRDIASRIMDKYSMTCETEPFERSCYMSSIVERVLNIHLGVRLYTHGEGTQRVTIFLPISAGEAAKQRIYYNIEHIIHQNLVTYDEIHDHYLPVYDSLIYRELEGVLERGRRKGNTRKKVINGLWLHTALMEDPTLIHHSKLGDHYYDKFNRIDLLDEASHHSRDLYNTHLIRSTEIASEATDNKVLELNMEEPVYIDRDNAVGQPAGQISRQMVSSQGKKSGIKAQSMKMAEESVEHVGADIESPAVVTEEAEPVAVAATVSAPAASNDDGMEEL